MTIPHRIQFDPPSDESICLHEAGHAVAGIQSGRTPVLMEFDARPGSPGSARCSFLKNPPATDLQRLHTATGAAAVEIMLFMANRLVDSSGRPVSNQQFLQAHHANAVLDINNFNNAFLAMFGALPANPLLEFKRHAQSIAEKIDMALVEKLAAAMMKRRHISKRRIYWISVPHRLAAMVKGSRL